MPSEPALRTAPTRCRLLVALAVVGTVLGASIVPAHATRQRRDPVSGEITVSAAASLTRAFDQIATAFHRVHPRATVTVNPGSSGALATQILTGAPVDVFAAADLATMDRLVAAGAVTAPPVVFARNSMTIVVKPGNPERVTGLVDLPRLPTVALCGATAPCGGYAHSVLERAGVTVPEAHVTRGVDATATLGAVASGDADAAVVYSSDGTGAGRTVTVVRIPPDQNVSAVYPIAPLAAAAHPKVARAFVAFVGSTSGRRILARNGFDAP